jgi:DNA-directed RNA polymerase specialized sigma24 family protein
MPPERQRWKLSAPAFDRLLKALDPDRDRAAVAYEQLRERIGGLLEWWGSTHAEELADETLDRVARKIEEGAVIAEGSFGAYVRGVARMVFHEAGRQAFDVPLSEREVVAPDEGESLEPALVCLDRCLDSLRSEERRLVLSYYEGERRMAARQELADNLGVSMTALRIRMHRVRERLEGCVTQCLNQ